MKTNLLNPPTFDLALMNLCESAAKIMVFFDSDENVNKLKAMHAHAIDEWDERMASKMAKIIEILMEP